MLFEQEDRSVQSILLLVHRVDALERALKADAGAAESFHSEDGAGQVAAGVGRTAAIEKIAITRRPEWVTPSLVPARGVTGGGRIKVIGEEQGRPRRSGAGQPGAGGGAGLPPPPPLPA